MNWLVSWKALRSAPVAASPSSWVSALVRALPVKPKMLTKFAGNTPLPKLNALFKLVATFW
jgi:hypothetical protein